MEINPTSLESYIGQKQIKRNLRIIIDAKKNQSFLQYPPMDHLLFSGPSGLGKTTLSEIIAAEMQCPIKKIMGPHLESPRDLEFLRGMDPWTFVFIDEIHTLPSTVEAALYEPMDSFKLRGRKINPFTLIGATTAEGAMSKPLRSRFPLTEKLTSYSINDLRRIVKRTAIILGIQIDDNGAKEVAKRARGTPRVANHLLKRVSYYGTSLTGEAVVKAFDSIGIDRLGLDQLDRKLLQTLAGQNVALGVSSLANILGEEKATIEEVREPYLFQAGLISRTSKGRRLTQVGIEYVKTLKA